MQVSEGPEGYAVKMNENTKKRKKYARKCCITGCTNVNKSEQIPYYHFPTHSTPWRNWKRQQWIDAVIKHNKQKDWEPTKSTVICGLHFAGGQKSEHPKHPAFNPTIFPGQCSKAKEKQVARFERRMKREKMKPQPIKVLLKTTKSKATSEPTEILIKPVMIAKESGTISTINTEQSPIELEDIEVVNTEPVFIKVEDMQIDDRELGFHNFQVQVNMPNINNVDATLPEYIMCNLKVEDNLNCAETQVNLKCPNPVSKNQKETLSTVSTKAFFKTPWLKPVEFNGISSINYDSNLEEIAGVNFVTFNQILKKLPVMDRLTISNANRLLIFLMKLKQGLTTSVLSVLFHLSPCTINRIIIETLEQLTLVLKYHVYWPGDREAMSKVLPNTFRHAYANFRAIVDCVEVQIEVPTDVYERIEFYTKYKSGLSFKIIFAFAPNGFITYRSKCYSGQKREALIAGECGFHKLIGDKDVILAVKKFPNLKAVAENRNAIFVTPPFVENSAEKYSVHACVLNSIDQIKLFKILSSIPAELVHKIDDVVQVCCALNNLRLPLKNPCLCSDK